jgi:Galactose oxidase, central domain
VLVGVLLLVLIPSASSLGSAALPTRAPSSASSPIAAAEQSLARGDGPAEGAPVNCSGASGQSASCSSVSPDGSDLGPSPPARWAGMMTYDASDGYVLMFGGSSKNDTWTFSDGRWTELSPPLSPSIRVWAPMTYDAADGYVLMFGGQGSGTEHRLLDTWTFHAGLWTNRTSSVGAPPSFSYGSSMAYDSEDGYVVLYGGGRGGTFTNATWTYVAGHWTNITRTAGTAPACRFDASMADDPAAGYVVLFGGNGHPNGGCFTVGEPVQLNDTWEFSGGRWTELSPATSPPARWMANLAYSTTGGYLMLFDGVSAQNFALADTWEYTVVHGVGNWHQVAVAQYPPARFSAMMAFDPVDGYFLLFGGLSETFVDAPLLADVWTFNGTAWANRTVAPTPSPRFSASMVYNPKGQFVLLFGGLGQHGVLGDTWRYAGGSWLELTPPSPPSARYGASIVYDATDGYVLFFGGETSGGAYLSDTWAFESGKTEWVELTPTASPSARANASLVDDVADGYVLLFGGIGASGPLGDTWTFVGGLWSKVTPATAPSARSSAAATYDGSIRSVVLFGGLGSAGALRDTWEFSGGLWSRTSSGGSGTPEARYGASLVYDPSISGDLLVGGTSASGPRSSEWKFSGGSWTALSFTTAPRARYAEAMTYDPLDGVVLLLSGAASGTPGLLGDEFTFSGASWSQVDFPALFTETGLPTGDAWSVSIGAGNVTSAGTSVLLLLPSDPYAWSIAPPANWFAENGLTTGQFVVTTGSEFSQAISFGPGYQVSFKESDLPKGTDWTVVFEGVSKGATGGTISFNEPNGSYSFTVSAAEYTASPSSGKVSVAGQAVVVRVSFAAS